MKPTKILVNGVEEEINKFLEIDNGNHLEKITEYWNQGSRSVTEMYRHPKKDEVYMIKQYVSTKYDEFITEKAILKVANKYIEGLFPKIFAYESSVLHENRILLCEGIKSDTLEQKIEKSDKITFSQIALAIKPITILHTQLSQYAKEIEDEMRVLSKGKLYRIYELSKYNCLKNIVTQFKNADKWTYKLISSLLEEYVFRDEYNVLAPHDGFPRQNLITRLVDAGNIYWTSCLIHLGCTIGLPIVQNKFENPHEEMKSCVNFYLQNTRIKADTNHFLTGLYLASVYANMRMINFNRRIGEKTDEYKSCAVKHARYVSMPLAEKIAGDLK
ncbi:MAG: hypothetical protein QW041_02600 [Candidatus Pacearchaeota archaeon]